MFPRSSGLLLHPTSLPSGRLDDDALRFLDFCAEAGQRWWQMLPVTPPGRARSPYSSPSAFAGSESLIDRRRRPPPAEGLEEFSRRQRHWLDDYALFRALQRRYSVPSWTRWPEAIRKRDPGALTRARCELERPIRRVIEGQYRFERDWRFLRARALERGVGLIGDLPIFVAHESADVWAHPELFKLAPGGRMKVVTGVPPDYFSADGQKWDNPHYDWTAHRRRRFRWWIARMRRMFELYDAVRIDHFLGFLRAWEVPARARSARRGVWVPGPGGVFFEALSRDLGRVKLIAEDLGLLTGEAVRLRDRLKLPGMRVLQFSFGPDPADRPFGFPRNSVVYTGTHDNDTAQGWLRAAGDDAQRALRYAGSSPRDFHWGLIRVALLSASDLAITPVPDLLGLGSEARMNVPGTTRGNWSWRLRPRQLTRRHARRLRELTEVGGR